jgi:uncharacterized protein YunC (DUF1805 family)
MFSRRGSSPSCILSYMGLFIHHQHDILNTALLIIPTSTGFVLCGHLNCPGLHTPCLNIEGA